MHATAAFLNHPGALQSTSRPGSPASGLRAASPSGLSSTSPSPGPGSSTSALQEARQAHEAAASDVAQLNASCLEMDRELEGLEGEHQQLLVRCWIGHVT